MSSDFVRCCVCFSDYDLEDHVAVVLSQCGHNVCQLCAEKLLESRNECPVCRKVFSNDDDTLYAPNRLIQEKLERETQYERCRVHANQLLELYCHTDKCKICLECHFNKGEGGHRGHEVERIADFKEQLDEKRELFEVREERYQAMYDEGKSLLGKRRQEQLDNFKSVERITKLVVFETYLGIKTVFDEEESKLEEQYGEDSSLRKEINSKIGQYSDIKKADFSVILEEDTERLAEDFDKPELAEYYEDLKTQETMECLSLPKITQHRSKIKIEAISLSQARLKSYLTFKMEGGSLIITASDTLNEKVCIDLNKWEKDLKGINIVFDKFNFNQDDLLLLEYIWIKLQPQIHLVGLEYRNTKNSDSTTKFEDHLYTFPRIIFSDPQNLKAIDLKFIEAKGSDRYTRLLTETYLAEASQLASLKLTYEDTDLGDNTLKNLMKNSKVLLKSLTQLSLTFRKMEVGKVFASLEHYFVLSNLKEFALNADFSYSSLSYQRFISNSLKCMNGLTKCELELKNSGMSSAELDTLFQNFYRMLDLGTLKIAIPELEVTPAKFQELLNFANRMKEPKDLKLDMKRTMNPPANTTIPLPTRSRLSGIQPLGTNPINDPLSLYNPYLYPPYMGVSSNTNSALGQLPSNFPSTRANNRTNINGANVSTNPAAGTGQPREDETRDLRIDTLDWL